VNFDREANRNLSARAVGANEEKLSRIFLFSAFIEKKRKKSPSFRLTFEANLLH
jgi:hypothetical protein